MENLTQAEKKIWSCWEQKTPREVVREAAAKGNLINLAEKFLMHKNGWSQAIAAEWFHAEVCAWIVQLLTRKQIFKALHILSKVQIDPEKHLMELARQSAEITFRDYIIEQLEKTSSNFNPILKQSWDSLYLNWNLLRLLEKSFEIDGTFKQNKVFGCGPDIIVVNESEIKALTIEKIDTYSDEWKSKVAAHLFFDTFEPSLVSFLNPISVWNHLLSQNKAIILVRWINIHTSEVVRDKNARYNFFNSENFRQQLLRVDTRGSGSEILETLDKLFKEWPITQEMIALVATSNCFAYTKMCVYDTLCSYGIVVDDERKNLYAIISRLARTQNLRLVDEIFAESCATMTKRDFYVEICKYCVTNKLYNALTVIVRDDVLGNDLSDFDDLTREVIDLWLLFKSIEQTSDKQSHVLPIYKTCQQIAKNDVNGYISQNPLLVLGMVLLHDHKKLFDIFNDDKCLSFDGFQLPNTCIKKKLPHLEIVYRIYSSPDGELTKDVNVYQLIAGYKGLDTSKVFEFQFVTKKRKDELPEKPDRRSWDSLSSSLNVDSTRGLVEIVPAMPSFSNPRLVKRYGYMAKLNHMYYLRQNRPCAASQAFILQQYQSFNRLQDKGIKDACCEAHALALQNWNSLSMAAAAVSFIAMIGCNPTRCTVHITVANMMKDHMVKVEEKTEGEATKKVSEYLAKLCQTNVLDTLEILQYLEEITIFNLNENYGPDPDITSILYESQTVVKFAILQGLPLPEKQLKLFAEKNLWFEFLLFGDVFRYPQQKMLLLLENFGSKCHAEHLKHIILHRNMEEVCGLDKDGKGSGKDGSRKLSRLSSSETSPTAAGKFEYSESGACGALGAWGDMWEAVSACHGPEDPPGALIRAASLHGAPLLALLATCYEPNAVGVCWAYWMLLTLRDVEPWYSQDSLQWDISEQYPPVQDFNLLAYTCVSDGFVRTLHESVLVFFPDSPVSLLTGFLCRCVWQRIFDSETVRIMHNFYQHCQRKYSVSECPVPWISQRQQLQEFAVSLVKIALIHCFDSALHQKMFLQNLVDAQFGRDFSVPCPDFDVILNILEISMETPSPLNVEKCLFEEDSAKKYIETCIDNYTADKQYSVALKLAKMAALPVDSILTAEWRRKHEDLLNKDECTDVDRTLEIAECSEAFKKADVSLDAAIKYLTQLTEELSDFAQRFYAYRIVLSWYDSANTFNQRREEIERFMWACYFQSVKQCRIFLGDFECTLNFVLSGQKDFEMRRSDLNTEKPFGKLLSEIEIECGLSDIGEVVELDDFGVVEIWKKTIMDLLEVKLIKDAFRLSAIYSAGEGYSSKTPCPVQVIRTCLQLAEGTASPYDLPPELRLVIAAPETRRQPSVSESSDASFEELVLIPEKQDGSLLDSNEHIAGREDADRLSALEALAARSGIAVSRQVANIYRIALQIGWPYVNVLKYQGNPIDFVNYVSGRVRMPLASLVFKTYKVPAKQVAEYLCSEMVAAIISPHLVKASSFRQKEHFKYTLWGYPLHSDIEMFLNMRPEACSLVGKNIIDHLVAFRKKYQGAVSKVKEEIDNGSIDLEMLIEEEYQTVEEEEVERIMGGSMLSDATGSSVETGSIMSTSTVNYSKGMMRESRRNLFDVISKSNVHIPYEVKDNIRKITKGAKLTSKQVKVISIELLVLAHECFSSACDAEGIAVALRSAQALATQLLAARSWRLMVRLLTGLARYTEMAYVFQILRDNHQFEFLLGQIDYMFGQHQEKITEFKQGLLDFLKNHCPTDTEAYYMVALHFNMYAEAAQLKKQQALDIISTLEKVALDTARANSKKPFKPPEWLVLHDTNDNRMLLEKALNLCTDAAELYLQGGCMGFAGELAGFAQQIALQISLLLSSPTRLILNRTPEQVYALIAEYLSFMEGLVLAQAGAVAQWRELAYRRALTNDQPYLRDMAAYRPDIAADVLQRYRLEKRTTVSSQAAMNELRNLL